MGTKPASGELNKALRPIFNSIEEAHIIHDDLILATRTEEEHTRVIREVLETIQEAGLTLNPEKCFFKKTEIPFWGMIISGDGVKPDPKKVEALRNATHPDNKADVMLFLCMLQSNTEFIPKLAQKTVHLRELTKKSVNFNWTKHCQNEFGQLKEALCENALLTYFDPERSTCIFVDAHYTGISAMLCQGEMLGEVQTVTCASRATTSMERKYPQLDLEALAVDFAFAGSGSILWEARKWSSSWTINP